jgi:tetratricopeptide (TPR) repeat protein
MSEPNGTAPANTASAATPDATFTAETHAGETATNPEQVKEAGKIAEAVKAPDPKPARDSSKALYPEARPHAFIVMPFGKKKGTDGQPFDFNAIYKTLIKPALEEAGFEPFRADEETASGDILTDMFQELLLADLVLCDLSIDNANAFYELGIRHALRKRGVAHIQAGRAYMPFDVFNVRTLPYHITPEGIPDPEFIRADITAISRLVKDTWASNREAIHSPIYNLLSGLKEPDRKSLQTPLATGFWREYKEWKEKVTVAQRQKHIGDILLLTEEIRNPLIREEAVSDVGRALANLGRHELALAQYREGLEVNSSNLEFRREEAFHLNRIGRVDEAIVKIESILNDHPNDRDTITYLGRIYKEMWVHSWKKIRDKTKRMQQAFDSYHWLIKSADIYTKGFRLDLNDYYPGINAFTLSTLAVHLAEKFDSKKAPDPDIARLKEILPYLRSSLIFGLESKIAVDSEKADYWTLVSLAELKVLTSDNLVDVVRAYRKAITASRRNLFSLNSSLEQLEMLKALEIRPKYVQAAIRLIREEITRVNNIGAKSGRSPRKLHSRKKTIGRSFLFSGYMIDHSGKEKKTFPADKEDEIRNDLRKTISKLKPTAADRAYLAGLSAGSEILFAEVCAELGVEVKAFLPLSESAYVRTFVSPASGEWVDRFYKIRNNPLVDAIHQFEHLGPPKEGDDPYERNNRWALYAALGRSGRRNLRLIAVWNETGGEPKDRDAHLVRHMIELTRDMGGAVEIISPSKYIHNVIDNALESLIFETETAAASKPMPGAVKRIKPGKK